MQSIWKLKITLLQIYALVHKAEEEKGKEKEDEGKIKRDRELIQKAE